MSITTEARDATARTYNLHRMEGNRAVYHGAAHTDLDRDVVIVQSTDPKRTAGSYGNRRSSINHVNTISITYPGQVDSVDKDIKCEVIMSIPAGATDDNVLNTVARIKGIVNDEVLSLSIFGSGQINQ